MSAFLPLPLVAVLLVAPAPEDLIVGRASVVDGDTVEIHGQRIRLLGMDALESRQTCADKNTRQVFRCGASAAWTLSEAIGEGVVSCEPAGRDRYQRVLARCTVGARDLASAVVKAGWAFVHPNYGSAYTADEAEARAAERGAWGTEFMWPWDWRHAR